MNSLSIIIPVYNEIGTVEELVDRVRAVKMPIEKEIIIVDDGSTDGTRELISGWSDVKVVLHEKNKGKGSAIRTGLEHASGDYVVIQDADLEYDPNDFKKMIKVVAEKNAAVVYGSRRLPNPESPHGQGQWYYYLGGMYLTFLTNLLYRTNITDEPTCYKMFKTNLVNDLNLVCTGFEFCPEVTAKVAKRGVKIFEVPISYSPRSVTEGKKIKFRDAIIATWVLLKNRFTR